MADMNFAPFGLAFESFYGSSSTFNNKTIDGTDDQLAFCFYMREAMTITHVGVYVNTITGAPGNLDVGIQGVNSTGKPDGTWKQNGGNDCKNNIAYTELTAGVWNWIALDYSYVASYGELLSIRINPTTGTFDASNLYSLAHSHAVIARQKFPCSWNSTDTGSTWSQGTTGYPSYAIKSATPQVQGLPIEAVGVTSYSSDSSPDEYGLKFVIPAGAGDTFKVVGARIVMSTPAVGKTFKMRLATMDGTELESITVDSDTLGSASSYNLVELYFDNAPTLTCGTTYVLSFEALETGMSMGIYRMTLPDANSLKAFAGGSDWRQVTRTNGSGAFADDATVRRPLVLPIISDWTEPAGGSASSPVFGGAIVR